MFTFEHTTAIDLTMEGLPPFVKAQDTIGLLLKIIVRKKKLTWLRAMESY